MIETFSYRTIINSREFRQTVYAKDVNESLNKWVEKIKDLQNEIYSFDGDTVLAIQNQLLDKSAKVLENDFNHHIVFSINNIVCITYIDKLKKSEPDFTAELYYLTAAEGGRKGYARSGYRPQFKIAGKRGSTSAEQIFIDKDKVFPGESVSAEIRILTIEEFKNQLYNGLDFELCEGNIIVARGKIIEVLNKDLKRS